MENTAGSRKVLKRIIKVACMLSISGFLFLLRASQVQAVAPTVNAINSSNLYNLFPASASISAVVNPNSLSTTAGFRYGTSNVACSSLSSTTATPNIGSGGSNVNINQGIAVTTGTVYYICAFATNSSGTTYGNVLSFTAPGGGTCSSVPQSGNYTMGSSCVFGAGSTTYDGVDSGTGTNNTAGLTISAGKTLTVGPGQTLGYGSITKTGAVITKFSGAILKKGPLWVPDTDSDGYPDIAGTTNQIVSTTVPGGYMRRGLANGLNADCSANDATKWQNLTGYPDSDGDTYSTGPSQQVCSGNSLPSGYKASNDSDCLDSGGGAANVYQNVTSLASDADNDGYYTGSGATVCVGTTSTINGRTYYKATSASFSYIKTSGGGGAIGGSDCCDAGNEGGYPGCNSTNKSGMNPGATEICGNGIDENCNGSDLSCYGYQYQYQSQYGIEYSLEYSVEYSSQYGWQYPYQYEYMNQK